MYDTIVILYVLVTVYFKSHNVWVRSYNTLTASEKYLAMPDIIEYSLSYFRITSTFPVLYAKVDKNGTYESN